MAELSAPWREGHGAEGSRLIWGRDESAESQFDGRKIGRPGRFVCHANARRPTALRRKPLVEREHDSRFDSVRHAQFREAAPDKRVHGVGRNAERQGDFLV